MNQLTAPALAEARAKSFALPREVPVSWLVALVGVLAALQLSMATGRSVNWDEFWFYSQVELVARGQFIQPLQTIHTRLFAWLPGLPGSEIDHILVARLFMWGCALGTAGCIYLLAEKFADRRTALLALAAYMGAGYVLQHATAFRVDPIVTALLTGALCVAGRTRLGPLWIALLGVLIGCAAMVTIKFVLWAPAFAGIALWQWAEEDYDWRYITRWFAAGAVAAGTFALLYTLHAGDAGAAASASASGTIGGSADRMIGFFDSPHADVAIKGAGIALPLLVAAVLAPVGIWRLDEPLAKRIGLTGLWAMLLTPVYYYNSYPYFYPFILPPVAVACAVSIPLITRRYGEALFAATVLLSALAIWFVDARGVTERQERLVEGVHAIFPQPVAYIDCCGMIGSFPKQNQFRTQWGVALYQQSGRPLILEAMEDEPIPLLLDNNREFSRAMTGEDTSTFHPDDIGAMRATYLRYWGDVFVAGREVAPATRVIWSVHVPGRYRVDGEALTIDGTAHARGAVVDLPRGNVTLSNPRHEPVTLIWADARGAPQSPPPALYWTAF